MKRLKILKGFDYIAFGICYIFKTKILRKNVPFIAGLVVGKSCNLNCSHCTVSEKNVDNDLKFTEILKGLKILYQKGIRLLAITGGEPFIWQDGAYGLEDIITSAREIGFKIISVYTNGTIPLNTGADCVFVSFDGFKAEDSDNKIIEKTTVCNRVINNINNSHHQNIIINCTINNINKDDIEEICEFVSTIKNVNGIFFYFHTPYYGKDNLFISQKEKKLVIEKLFLLKKKYRIFNSVSALKDVYYDTRERPSDLCLVYAGNKIYKCCRSVDNKEVCPDCGYMGYPEIINITKLKPSAILSAINYLPGNS